MIEKAVCQIVFNAFDAPLFHDVIKNMKQLGVILYLLCLTTCYELWATPHNVAYQAKVTCTSALSHQQ